MIIGMVEEQRKELMSELVKMITLAWKSNTSEHNSDLEVEDLSEDDSAILYSFHIPSKHLLDKGRTLYVNVSESFVSINYNDEKKSYKTTTGAKKYIQYNVLSSFFE